MYFLPLLFGLVAFLLYPSILLSTGVAILVWSYLQFAGFRMDGGKRLKIRGQLAYRILSVKLLSLNGGMTDETYKHHAQLTPDEPETSELRSDLRNAAYSTGDGWEFWAREVRKVYKRDPLVILDRYEILIVQLQNGEGGLSDKSQDRLIQIGKMWGVGPNKAREFLADVAVTPSPNMAAW